MRNSSCLLRSDAGRWSCASRPADFRIRRRPFVHYSVQCRWKEPRWAWKAGCVAGLCPLRIFRCAGIRSCSLGLFVVGPSTPLHVIRPHAVPSRVDSPAKSNNPPYSAAVQDTCYAAVCEITRPRHPEPAFSGSRCIYVFGFPVVLASALVWWLTFCLWPWAAFGVAALAPIGTLAILPAAAGWGELHFHPSVPSPPSRFVRSRLRFHGLDSIVPCRSISAQTGRPPKTVSPSFLAPAIWPICPLDPSWATALGASAIKWFNIAIAFFS